MSSSSLPQKQQQKRSKSQKKKKILPRQILGERALAPYAAVRGPPQTSARTWGAMMVDPRSSTTVLSPTMTPEPMSVAHLYRNIELAYADTVDGRFAIIQSPSVKNPLLIAKGSSRYPAVGDTTLDLRSSQATVNLANGETYLGGWLINGIGTTDNRLAFSKNIVASGTTRHGFELSATVGTTITFAFSNKSLHTVKFGLRGSTGSGGVWSVLANLTAVTTNSTVSLTIAPTAAAYVAFAVQVTDLGNGVLDANADWRNKLQIAMVIGNGYIPAPVAPQSIMELVTDDLLEAGEVSRTMISAMSCLVTNTASPLNSGGNIAVGRVRRSALSGVESIEDLYKTITAIIDPKSVYNGPLTDGGYAWYLPDDLESYTPMPEGTGDAPDDNVLVFVGQMQAGGSVRIAADFVAQFYTPKQVFSREYTPAFTDPYRLVLSSLVKMQAVSANAWHDELIRKVKDALRASGQWVLDHPQEAAAIAAKGLALFA